MADFVVIDGDMAQFLPSFGMATVVVQPGTMRGSGPATKEGKALCLAGDEANLQVPGCTYMTAQHTIPGVGTLGIQALAGDQQTVKTTHQGKALILVGGQFQAKFAVSAPAMQPPPGLGSPIPDATPQYSGQGMFVTTNSSFRAT
jgi:hypothetical protein